MTRSLSWRSRVRRTIEVDLTSGTVTIESASFRGEPPSAVAQMIMQAGTLVDLVKTRSWAAIEQREFGA